MNLQEIQASAPRYKLGVALGGGSARGYAHLGALASLERHDLAPDLIVGTSFGAVVGALYATGRGIDVLKSEAESMRRRDVLPHIADFGLHRAALFGGDRLEAFFDRLLEGRTFADLEKKLVVVTTDIDSGEQVLLEEGSLARALRASASIPGIFAPVVVGGRRLVDGGIGSPVPLGTLEALSVDVAIGIGAGMEGRDSGAIRLARRVLLTPQGKRIHTAAVTTRPRGPLGRLGRALAFAAEGWLRAEAEPEPAVDAGLLRAEVKSGAPAGSDVRRRLEVHTRPPISWLNFNRAAEAIRAGDAALSQLVPSVKLAMALD